MDWVEKAQNYKGLYGILQLLRGSHLNNFPLKTLNFGWVAFHSLKFQLKCLDFRWSLYKKLIPVLSRFCNWLLASFFFSARLMTSTPSRSINTQKRNSVNIQPSWPHPWSITHVYVPKMCLVEMLNEFILHFVFCLHYKFPLLGLCRLRRLQFPFSGPPKQVAFPAARDATCFFGN